MIRESSLPAGSCVAWFRESVESRLNNGRIGRIGRIAVESVELRSNCGRINLAGDSCNEMERLTLRWSVH